MPGNINGSPRIISVAQHFVGVEKILCTYITHVAQSSRASWCNKHQQRVVTRDKSCAWTCKTMIKSKVQEIKGLISLATYIT